MRASVRSALFVVLLLGIGPCPCSSAQTPEPHPAPKPPELIGAARLPGGTPDRSGLTEPMRDGIPSNLVGGFGSGLAYSGHADLYFAIADRGPGDGAYAFRDRFHLLRIAVKPGADKPVEVAVERTGLLTDEKGRAYVGAASAFDAADQAAGMRLDPEGIACTPHRTVWTSDEYGPWFDEWTLRGEHVTRIAPPPKFRIAHPGATPAQEMPPYNTSGRQANRGMEGLAISADGTRLYGIMQSPLLQDGAVNGKNKRIGVNIRLIELTLDAGGQPAGWREFVYCLDSPANGVNELCTVGDGRFLVIEKDGKEGENARTKKIYRIDISGATDVSGVASLPTSGLPDGVRPVAKTLVIDMLDPRFGLAGPTMPEKVEGLAFGPDLPDGRRLLIVASDNDYDVKQPSWVWVFALDPADAGEAERPR